jgi:hypothetical protein
MRHKGFSEEAIAYHVPQALARSGGHESGIIFQLPYYVFHLSFLRRHDSGNDK